MNEEEKQLAESIIELSQKASKLGSFWGSFWRGIFWGLGSAIGASIVAAGLIWCLNQIFRTADGIPVINEISKKIEIKK